jgi:hypothetical protein
MKILDVQDCNGRTGRLTVDALPDGFTSGDVLLNLSRDDAPQVGDRLFPLPLLPLSEFAAAPPAPDEKEGE